MNNFSKTSLFSPEDGYIYNYTWTSSNSSDEPHLGYAAVLIIIIFSTLNCITGLVGNGIVICLLGFYIKRSPFTTYILNLAVADFGVLLFTVLSFILTLTENSFLALIAGFAVLTMYITSQLLLTAISVDRCVSVLFPIWYRNHRPPHLSTIVCTLIWVLSCLSRGVILMVSFLGYPTYGFSIYPFIATTVLCLPLVTVSTLLLLSKAFCKLQRSQRGRLLTVVFLTLLCFLIFAFPLNAFIILNHFTREYGELEVYGVLCATLNSWVNPVIYFMVGRKKTGHQRRNLKVILQRAFKE